MSPRTAFMFGAPVAFGALLTQHPMADVDFFTGVSANVTPWLIVHLGGAVLFPAMALVVWLLIRDLSSRPATVARIALPVYAVFYGVFEAVMGIASGVLAHAGSDLEGAERQGLAEAVNSIPTSPIVGDPGLFVSVGTIAWWVAISGAIMALKRAGASRASLVLLGIGGLMVFYAVLGPIALPALGAAAYLIERRRPSTRESQSFSNRPSGSSSARAAWNASHSG
jgi:drug/metabolite transporter (DMT)-like permease